MAHTFQGKEVFGRGQTYLLKGKKLKNHGSSPSPGPSLAQGLSPSQVFKTKKTLDGQREKRPSLVGLEEGQGGERLQEPKPMQHT